MLKKNQKLALVMSIFLLGSCKLNRPADYFPLTVGQSWQYQVQRELVDGNAVQSLAIQVKDEIRLVIDSTHNQLEYSYSPAGAKPPQVDSQQSAADFAVDTLLRETSDGTSYYIVDREDGYYRVAKKQVVETQPQLDIKPRLILPKGKNLRLGFVWTLQTHPFAVHWMAPFSEMNASIKPFDMVHEVASLDDTVLTPAGEFTKCVRIDGTGKMVVYADPTTGYQEVLITQSEWYAPGVGLVKLERNEPLNKSVIKGGKVTLYLATHRS